MNGEMGYPSALTAPTWGFYDVVFGGKPFSLSRPYSSYVVEHILFKISFPAEFHAQTAAECAIILHPQVIHRLEQIEKIVITTQESAIRIIDKVGPLSNPADRDHCIQYIVAIGLLFGNLTSDDYEDVRAVDPRIDMLRSKMVVEEEKQYSRDYLNPEKRSIANAVQVYFRNGMTTEKVVVEYPLGHRRRRTEGQPLLEQKFVANLSTHFSARQMQTILEVCLDQQKLQAMTVQDFLSLFVV
jgi:2-methylcitrate dehydratase